MGILYIIATPIGNLEDISIRAIKTLLNIPIIACEDTRRTGILLRLLDDKYHEIIFEQGEIYRRADLISYHEHNEQARIPEIIAFLEKDINVALISDAGTPAISDPGFKLIRECIKLGITVESIPGASSLICALVVSGLPTDKFIFIGYPPKKAGHRISLFENIKQTQKIVHATVILLESPHKLQTTLDDLLKVFGDIEIVICRELTKVFESKRREKISESLKHYKEIKPKGEYVLLFHLTL
jgi:16S rRNA (cytidine1402-2'-O)-methyltransferase